MLLESHDVKGRRVMLALTGYGASYRDITPIYRWYRLIFIPGIVIAVAIVASSILYAIMAYQWSPNALSNQLYILLAALASSIAILLAVRLTRPKSIPEILSIPIDQLLIILYTRSRLLALMRLGSQTPELVIKLSEKSLSNVLRSARVEPWGSRLMVYEM